MMELRATKNYDQFVFTHPTYESRVNLLEKSLTGNWTDEDKEEVECGLKDFKGAAIAKKYFRDRNMRKITCCICGCDFYDQTGCNPWPIMDGENNSCCHRCDDLFVQPVRSGEKPGSYINLCLPRSVFPVVQEQ